MGLNALHTCVCVCVCVSVCVCVFLCGEGGWDNGTVCCFGHGYRGAGACIYHCI